MLRFDMRKYIKAENLGWGDIIPNWVVQIDNEPVNYDYDTDELVVFKTFENGKTVKRWLVKEDWCRESLV